MSSSYLDDILNLPSDKRRRLNLKRTKKKRYKKRFTRNSLTKEELIIFLRENNITTSRQLLKFRSEKDPVVYDYLKEFGRWNRAIEIAFPNRFFECNLYKTDPFYFVKIVIEFNLWTQEKYLLARKQRPDIIPSICRVRSEWGKWSNLKIYAQNKCLKIVLESYVSLWRRLGRCPSLDDCRNNNIILDEAIKKWGSKSNLDSMIRKLEKFL